MRRLVGMRKLRYKLAALRQPARRWYAISTGKCQAPVVGTYYTSRIDAEDRRFAFATIVLDSVKNGQSAAPAFSQACSLLGTNHPTLAVVFVSTATPSAISAIHEVASFLPDAAPPRFGPALIGCVADVWNAGAPASSSSGPSQGGGRSGRNIPVASSVTMVELSNNASVTMVNNASVNEDDEVADFQALLGECTKWTRENPGVISDDESLVTLEREIETSATDLKTVLDGIKQSQAEQQMLPLGSPSRKRYPAVYATSTNDGRPTEGERPSADGDTPRGYQEVSGGGDGDGAGHLQDEDDGTFRMVLCLGHLPSTKAIAFHTSTTGVPHLPDLEVAVTTNNPHMFLLGAPGYPYPEFIQRLSTLFPESSRAGVFMAPLYSLARSRSSSSYSLFHGKKLATAGVVGLAISSEDKNGNVPTDAFRELLRMSLGMTRVAGQTFFDNAISKCLFYPKNVTVTREATSRVDPSMYLNQLDAYLTKRRKLHVQTHMNPNTSASGGRTCAALLGNHLNASSADGPENDERMPLALLGTVLFPGWSMPLHFHEPRYMHLVRHCVEQKKPFGLMSYLNWQNPEELVGTMATLKVYLLERDCRSYVAAHGTKRFRVPFESMTVQPGSFGLNEGQVEFFDDLEIENPGEVLELARQLVDRCKQLLPEVAETPELCGEVLDPTMTSFAVGQLLPVPVRLKRRWLGMVDTKSRLLEQMTFLNE